MSTLTSPLTSHQKSDTVLTLSVIRSALNLINRELSGLGLAEDPSAQLPLQGPPEIPLNNPIYPMPDMANQQPPMEQSFQSPWANNFGAESMIVDPGVFEAMSSLQPLSVRVGEIHESSNQGLG